MAAKPSLVGMTRPEMAAAMTEAGVPERELKMRASQLWHWVYERGVQEFDQIANVSKAVKSALGERFTLARPDVVAEQISTDGTRKWLLRADGGDDGSQDYEMVFIPDADRGTLCVSSQIGCTLNCRFCHTGTMRLVRNLTAGEIVGQVMLARDALGEWPSHPDGRLLTNIVMMGMGEPLYNAQHVGRRADDGTRRDGDRRQLGGFAARGDQGSA